MVDIVPFFPILSALYRFLVCLVLVCYLLGALTSNWRFLNSPALYLFTTWSFGFGLWVSPCHPSSSLWYSAVFFHYFFLYLVLFVVAGLIFFRRS